MGHVVAMRLWMMLAIGAACLAIMPASSLAASGKVIKVLPQFLDAQGRHTLSPSLYERDAYQAHLRKHPELRSGLRFAIQWRAKGATNLKLRVELRGMRENKVQTRTLETPVERKAALEQWAMLVLSGDDYKQFGELSAWRATLWDGDQLLAEQKSFMW
jgi:hypothetical protein